MLNVKIPNETDRKLGKHFLEPQYNMINKTILNEYNQLFDEIMAIEIQDIVHEKNDNQSSKEVLKKYTFSEGLCARRLKKCSVEGGVMRAKKLQEKFLAHQVNINENDDKKTYFDPEETDVIQLTFVFGEYVKFEKREDKLFLVHASTIRNRFDLLAETEDEQRRSAKLMEAFVKYMDSVVMEQPGKFPHLSINYFTSHSLSPEIEKYSKMESKYVLLCFLVYGLLLLVLFIFSTTVSRPEKNLFSLSTHLSSTRMYMGVLLLVMSIPLQILLTFSSAFGLLAVFNVNPNFLTATIIFIVTIVAGNQSYLIFVHMNRHNDSLSRRLEKQVSDGSIQQLDLNNITLRMTAQRFLIPICYSSLTAISTYSTISAVDGFESIRIYCIFTSNHFESH